MPETMNKDEFHEEIHSWLDEAIRAVYDMSADSAEDSPQERTFSLRFESFPSEPESSAPESDPDRDRRAGTKQCVYNEKLQKWVC